MKSVFPKWKFLHRLIRVFEGKDVNVTLQDPVPEGGEEDALLYSSLFARVIYNNHITLGTGKVFVLAQQEAVGLA